MGLYVDWHQKCVPVGASQDLSPVLYILNKLRTGVETQWVTVHRRIVGHHGFTPFTFSLFFCIGRTLFVTLRSVQADDAQRPSAPTPTPTILCMPNA